MKNANVTGRRDVLKAAGAGLVAAAVPSVAAGALAGERIERRQGPTTAPSPSISTDAGGTTSHPEVNSQFEIKRVTKHGNEITFDGEVTQSRDPSLLGLPVKIVAEKLAHGNGKASITVGSDDGHLVVIAILIGLLTPQWD